MILKTTLMLVTFGLKPFNPKYPHTNSPDCSPYIFVQYQLGEIVKRSKLFPFGDHFVNFYNPFFLVMYLYYEEKFDVGHS